MLPVKIVEEFQYGDCIDGVFVVKLFPYSGWCHVTRIFGELFSLREGDVAPADLTVHTSRNIPNSVTRAGQVNAEIGALTGCELSVVGTFSVDISDSECDIFQDDYFLGDVQCIGWDPSQVRDQMEVR